MKKVVLGKPLPDFIFQATTPDFTSLKSLLGKNHIVLYFYPKDNTPGCTTESETFRDNFAKFTKLKTSIVGISRDSLNSHQKFLCKLELPFPLISDETEEICNLFEVIVPKNMYGKQVKGIERSTFLIDNKGIVRHIWRKVKIENHVEEVLKAVMAL
jgi:peroxiredoxin Q/BCP